MSVPKVTVKEITKTKYYLTFWNNGKRIKRLTYNGRKRDAELLAAHYCKSSKTLGQKIRFK